MMCQSHAVRLAVSTYSTGTVATCAKPLKATSFTKFQIHLSTIFMMQQVHDMRLAVSHLEHGHSSQVCKTAEATSSTKFQIYLSTIFMMQQVHDMRLAVFAFKTKGSGDVAHTLPSLLAYGTHAFDAGDVWESAAMTEFCDVRESAAMTEQRQTRVKSLCINAQGWGLAQSFIHAIKR
eukprot:1159261-Pelagomonas_calceolata.AAC.8